MLETQIIGNRIKTLREAKKITQSELARQLNVSRQIISYYETGARMPNTEDIALLAKYFEVPADYLLNLSDSTSTDLTEREISDLTGLEERPLGDLIKNNSFLKSLEDIIIKNPNDESTQEYINVISARLDFINLLADDSEGWGFDIATRLYNYKEALLNAENLAYKAVELAPFADKEVMKEFFSALQYSRKGSKIRNIEQPAPDDPEALECLTVCKQAIEAIQEARYISFEIIESFKSFMTDFCDGAESNAYQSIAEMYSEYEGADE